MKCAPVKLADGTTVLAMVKPGAVLTDKDKEILAEFAQFCRKHASRRSNAALRRNQQQREARPSADPGFNASKLAELPSLRLLLLWRSSGAVHSKTLDWRRPPTYAALDEYLQNYFERIDNGYIPEGYETAPRPFCARILRGSRVLAEWRTTC